MQSKTLEKLQKNPYYKMSSKQEPSRPPMVKFESKVEYGQFERHDHAIPMHQVATQPIARVNKRSAKMKQL